MRKLLYVVFGLMIFAGSAGLLYSRQMQLAGDAPSAAQSEPKAATRGLGPEAKDRREVRSERAERRIDRGLRQYKRDDGSWRTFEAVIDVLNVVVGMVGIGLALSGLRARKTE
jgi:hypothetical protein